MVERLKTKQYKGKEILVIDYSDLKEPGMITLISDAKHLVLEQQKPILVLSIFTRKNYVSPKFLRHAEAEIKAVEHLIRKNSIVGLSQIQLWIVRGINRWHKSQLHPFNSEEEALEFLVS
jgi:hypothetical protein